MVLLLSLDLEDIARHLLSSKSGKCSTLSPEPVFITLVDSSKGALNVPGNERNSISTCFGEKELVKVVWRVRGSMKKRESDLSAFLASRRRAGGAITMSISSVIRLDPRATAAAPPTNAHLKSPLRQVANALLASRTYSFSEEIVWLPVIPEWDGPAATFA